MKNLQRVLGLILLSVSSLATAYHRGHYHGPRHYPRRPVIVHRPGVRVYPTVHTRCSPEVQQKNLAVLESTLQQFATSENFHDAKVFHETVAKIQAESSAQAKVAAYLQLAGVDLAQADEVAEFLGARDHSVYIERAQTNLSLSDAQADELVTALRGSLLAGVNGPTK